MTRAELAPLRFFGRYGVVVALILLIAFGAWRYDNFLGAFNILSFLRYNSMFALVALGMAFVIMTGGIDLSVGAVAALGSVVAALVSPYGLVPGLLAGMAAGLAAGIVNGLVITRLGIVPFIATLATMLAAGGTALLLAKNQSVSVSYESGFTELGQGNLLGFPIPAWMALVCYGIGSVVLNFTSFGRTVLALGGNEDATRMMGLHGRRHPRRPVRRRAADRGRRLGALRYRRRRGGGHAAHRRQRLGRHHARRRHPAWADLQHPEFRERPRLDQPIGLLAVSDPRPVPARRRRAAGEAGGPHRLDCRAINNQDS
jgi:hypothetical protein